MLKTTTIGQAQFATLLSDCLRSNQFAQTAVVGFIYWNSLDQVKFRKFHQSIRDSQINLPVPDKTERVIIFLFTTLK